MAKRADESVMASPSPVPGPAALASRSGRRVVLPKAARVVAETLQERILTQEFTPGEPLPPADELIEEFGVSRPTLREAMNVLEADGLVRLRRGPGGGAIVQAPDTAAITRSLDVLLRFEGTTVERIMEVRLVVDPLAARLAAERAEEEDIERIAASLERQQRPEVARSYEKWLEENLYFHWAIAAASRNPVVRVISESLHNIALTAGLKVKVSGPNRRRSVSEHSAVYDAIASRDAALAESTLRAHVERSWYLRRKNAD